MYGKKNGTRRCLNGLHGHEDRLRSKPFFHPRKNILRYKWQRYFIRKSCMVLKKIAKMSSANIAGILEFIDVFPLRVLVTQPRHRICSPTRKTKRLYEYGIRAS